MITYYRVNGREAGKSNEPWGEMLLAAEGLSFYPHGDTVLAVSAACVAEIDIPFNQLVKCLDAAEYKANVVTDQEWERVRHHYPSKTNEKAVCIIDIRKKREACPWARSGWL